MCFLGSLGMFFKCTNSDNCAKQISKLVKFTGDKKKILGVINNI